MTEIIRSELSRQLPEIKGISQISTPDDRNRTYKVICADRTYALKMYVTKDEARVKVGLCIQDYFFRRGFECPSPMRVSGEFLFQIEDNLAALFEYAEGKRILIPSQEEVSRMVESSSCFYELGKDYHGRCLIKKWELPKPRPGKFYEESIRFLNQMGEIGHRIDDCSLTSGLIHGDLNHGQFLFCDNEIMLLDFERVSRGAYLRDIASLLFFLKSDSRNSHIDGNQIVRQYLDSGVIEQREVHFLKDMVCAHSISYLLGRIWQFNHGQTAEIEVLKSIRKFDNVEEMVIDGF